MTVSRIHESGKSFWIVTHDQKLFGKRFRSRKEAREAVKLSGKLAEKLASRIDPGVQAFK